MQYNFGVAITKKQKSRHAKANKGSLNCKRLCPESLIHKEHIRVLVSYSSLNTNWVALGKRIEKCQSFRKQLYEKFLLRLHIMLETKVVTGLTNTTQNDIKYYPFCKFISVYTYKVAVQTTQ